MVKLVCSHGQSSFTDAVVPKQRTKGRTLSVA